MWRGSSDHHATIQSQSPKDVTRWGTSIQLTSAAVSGMHKAISAAQDTDLPIGTFITTAKDRLERLIAHHQKKAMKKAAATQARASNAVHGKRATTTRLAQPHKHLSVQPSGPASPHKPKVCYVLCISSHLVLCS